MIFKEKIKDSINVVYNSINSNNYSSDLFFKVRDYIEKYPNENDFDLATYMCEELLNKRNK